MQDTVHLHAAVIERWVLKRVSGVDSVVHGEASSFKLLGPGTPQYLPSQRFVFTNAAPLPVTSCAPSAVSGGSFAKDSRYLLDETASSGYGRVTSLTDARGKVFTYGYGGNANNAFPTTITKVTDGSRAVNLVTTAKCGTDQHAGRQPELHHRREQQPPDESRRGGGGDGADVGRRGGELHLGRQREPAHRAWAYSLTASSYDSQNLPLSFTRSGTTTTCRYSDVGQRIAKQVGAGNTEVYLEENRNTSPVP